MLVENTTGINKPDESRVLPGMHADAFFIEAKYLEIVGPQNPTNPAEAISIGDSNLRFKEGDKYFDVIQMDPEESGFVNGQEGDSSTYGVNTYTMFHKEWTVENYAWAENMSGRRLVGFLPHECDKGNYWVMGEHICGMSTDAKRMAEGEFTNTSDGRSGTITFGNRGLLLAFTGNFPITPETTGQSPSPDIATAGMEIAIITPTKVKTYRGETIDLTTIDQATATDYGNDTDFPYLVPSI